MIEFEIMELSFQVGGLREVRGRGVCWETYVGEHARHLKHKSAEYRKHV